MKANEFKKKLDTSHGIQLIVAGLASLVEDEGYSPHEAFEILDSAKQNTFQALSEMNRGG